MSLTFYDEHLAWQQRIQKEVVRAAMVQPKYAFNYSESPTRLQEKPRSLSPQKRVIKQPIKVYAHLNAELRGKYSRHVNPPISPLPQIRRNNNQSATPVHSRGFSAITSNSYFSDFEGKTAEELKEVLREERYRRLRAEKRLKTIETSCSNE